MFDNSTQTTLRKVVRSHELILEIRRRLLWIIPGCLLAFALSYWYSARFFLFESRVFVDVSPAPVFLNPQEANRQPVDIFRNSEYVMRVIQFTRSDRMTEYLEKKFSLFKHYKIPPDAPYAYERLSRALTNVILVKKSPFDNVVISVQDNNRDFAASLANEIALACNVLAREYFTEIISAKMVYYDELHRNLMDDFEKKSSFSIQRLKKSPWFVTRRTMLIRKPGWLPWKTP